MKEVHLTVYEDNQYWCIYHRTASEVVGNIVILQLPDMVPIRMVAVPGKAYTADCRHCPVYSRNIPGIPMGVVLTCTNCRRSFDEGYHYENIDKVLEGL